MQLFNKYLLACLHFETNSERLFDNFSVVRVINNFQFFMKA